MSILFRWPWTRDNPPIKRTYNIVDVLISQEVFRGVIFVLIATGSAWFGYSQPKVAGPNQSTPPRKWTSDPTFYSLLWQVIFQLAASYCTLVPVIRDAREARKKVSKSRGKSGRDSIYDAVFYTCISTSVITSFMAPFIYAGIFTQEAAVASNALNFISTVFSVIAACQLAGKICPGTLSRSWGHRERYNYEGDNGRV